ncbi:MAG: hypothetical protein HYZ50_21310 [Deltaproteobacteria bacterium]|nr:hypothetical protein [Deltaproteobacteria bacterium]
MAIHRKKEELAKESIYEMLHVAEYAVTHRKTDKAQWGDNATGGILGYPATVILFSITDCLGSYFANDPNFTVNVDGKEWKIKQASQHIYILNSKYFNLDLSRIDLDNIYKNVRSVLIHNSLLPEGYLLQVGENEELPFNIAVNEFDNRIYFINVIKLFEITKKAVEEFMDDLDKGDFVFDSSAIHSNVSKRNVPTPMYLSSLGRYHIRIKKWIKK